MTDYPHKIIKPKYLFDELVNANHEDKFQITPSTYVIVYHNHKPSFKTEELDEEEPELIKHKSSVKANIIIDEEYSHQQMFKEEEESLKKGLNGNSVRISQLIKKNANRNT